MDLGDKVGLLDNGDSVISWCWEPHFSWNSRAFLGSLPLTPFDQCKPSNPKWCRGLASDCVFTGPESDWGHVLPADFMSVPPGQAEVPDGVSQEVSPVCGEGREMGVPVPVSLCISLRKVAQDPCHFGLQGGPRWQRDTLGSPGTVPGPDTPGRGSHVHP